MCSKKNALFVIVSILFVLGFEFEGSTQDALNVPSYALDDPELAAIDSMLVSAYLNYYCYTHDSCLLNVFGFDSDETPEIDQDILQSRMSILNESTPFDLVYNKDVSKFVDLYAVKRKSMTSRVMGTSELYFPMFEEALDKYDMPLELKYLAVVESALNPTAKSRAGAVGLWQFMYSTGKMYGLNITSYVDDRMDPVLATDAACRYLLKLFEIYDDWNLALAAYNSGPGNVNKAIRRSGGKRDYWGIRPWLPKETRGYVPAFIAACYVMNHATEHNIYPERPSISYFESDTILIRKKVRFDQISAFTEMSEADLEFLNPAYKKHILPGGRVNILRLPVEEVGRFITNEDSIYNYRLDEAPEIIEEERITYTVRNGDVLGTIASRHHVSVSSIKSWNNLRGNTIYPGQKLVIYQSSTNSNTPKKPTPKPKPQQTGDGYHTVRDGDTLWDIAKLYEGVSLDDLKAWNKGINLDRLSPGQKIKITE